MGADLTDFALDLAATEPDCLPSATFLTEEGVVDQVRSALGWGARVFKNIPYPYAHQLEALERPRDK
jgi:hypothetical protein